MMAGGGVLEKLLILSTSRKMVNNFFIIIVLNKRKRVCFFNHVKWFPLSIGSFEIVLHHFIASTDWLAGGSFNSLSRALSFKSYHSQINTSNNKNNSTIASSEGCPFFLLIPEKKFLRA